MFEKRATYLYIKTPPTMKLRTMMMTTTATAMLILRMPVKSENKGLLIFFSTRGVIEVISDEGVMSLSFD